MNANISIIAERPATHRRTTTALRATAPARTATRLSPPRSGLCCRCRMILG
ncbi:MULTISPECIES: hypothetical protein [Rhodopseudomonas]|uniref:hypothetical protein n=1 Tax=Rhodopseudomonas TaxID=1073 RepID=UPI00142DC321|nr:MULTISPECIES: hypothetical protein [Rhodopseudomonas]